MSKHEGDKGMTFHPRVGRVSKSSCGICAIGEIDELNSFLGLLHASLPKSCDGMKSMLIQAQQALFKIGTCESGIKAGKEDEAMNTALSNMERCIAAFEEEAGPLRHFVIPGGHSAACTAHVARSVCRRAERAVVALSEQGPGEASARLENALIYLNRLSTFLFAMARVVNLREKIAETRP